MSPRASTFVLPRAERARLRAPDGSESLRFDDVLTFLTVHHTRSISGAARQLQVTPSQVSKAVARMEAYVGAQLLTRSARGVSVSLAGLRAIPMLEEIARGVRHLRVTTEQLPMVRIAAPSSILGAAAGLLARTCDGHRFQCLELDPVRTRALAFEDVFDVALLAEDKPLGDVYGHERVGEASSCLLARPGLAAKLGPGPVPAESLRGVPFVMPAMLADTRVVQGKDLCPMPFEERTQGHSAASFGAALELAASSDQIVFGPRVAARPWLDRGELVELPVEGWDIRWSVWMACHGTRVQAKTAKAMRRALEAWLGSEA
jgi:DNA-binding transcriptional LysR family regulator